ncbi:MAG: isochorismate synthase [Anaerolineales bacterium]|uniref:isochorismate synthase n=1 Tax=Candidatus Desulfolinea nitratireducens TaxID=2841698 RepID=A0A8J6THM8_9CHLR|nr:isochorismate synthase [Candidatus Desulfolinea nitratireducens]
MVLERERLRISTNDWKVSDPLALLDSLHGQPRWAWMDKEQTLVAWGKVATFPINELEAQLEQLKDHLPEADIPLFGSLPFDQTSTPDDIWSDFATLGFILPRFIYRHSGSQGQLTEVHSDQELPEIFRPPHLNWHPDAIPSAQVTPKLSFSEWEAMIWEAQRQIENGHIQKVVFARALDVTFARTPPLVTVFSRLANRYPNTYRFYFEPVPGHVFLGATPELLVRTRGCALETVAMAGSIRRGQTPHEEDELGAALLANQKDRLEQAIVVERICNELSPLCDSFQYPKEPVLRRLPNIQHLETPIRGRLKRPGLLGPAQALHPTPALAGHPRQAALEMIRQSEPLPRGAYGAPVGWITPQGDGELTVAIRSAIFRGSAGRLYAGAGILAESQPEKEWQETELKFRPMMEALGLIEEETA